MNKQCLLFLSFLLFDSCLDRLKFDVGELNDKNLVIMGSITDQPGPYEVRFYLTSNVDDDLLRSTPYSAKHVYIVDDVGTVEELFSNQPGIYQTAPDGIRGMVGRKYHLRVETLSGNLFESDPDELKAVPEIDSLYSVWDAFSPIHGEPKYGFKIFMNTKKAVATETYLRWKYKGTFQVETYPRMHTTPICSRNPDPLPCSGYTVINGIVTSDGSPCTCCYCWVDDYESKPQLSDGIIPKEGTLANIQMGYVRFDEWRFEFRKYLITIEQSSLSQNAYSFWKVIKDQKEGISSLFQPSFGKIPTNFHSKNSEVSIIGLFNASAVTYKTLLLTPDDSPLPVPQHSIDPHTYCPFSDACDKAWLNASRVPPTGW